jgi:hypothetical protein
MISKTFTIYLFFILLCSFSINCNKERSKLLGNLHVEFQPQMISDSIIEKFYEIFEQVPSAEEELEDDLYDDEDDDSWDESYEEEYQLDDYSKSDQELPSLLKQNETTNEEPLEDSYKEFVYKLCVLTALSKETTIHASESMSV